MMNPETFAFTQIGVIRTRFTKQEGTPIQASMADGEIGTVEVFPEYADGLLDIGGFSHLHLIYAFHEIEAGTLRVKPYLDTVEHGIFATRAPKRPNPVGLSVVRLLSVRGNILEIAGVDMIDGTPLLDIKPYIPSLDARDTDRIGWYAGRLRQEGVVLADGRFDSKEEH
ncbi:MAG TPA: tRNA (N6-threonylcarbamoyladenosine(37)-N6)-methyltransferase TrmO [Candidatus Ozemobacteraceae bacterium]